jgi:hypothetical protein
VPYALVVGVFLTLVFAIGGYAVVKSFGIGAYKAVKSRSQGPDSSRPSRYVFFTTVTAVFLPLSAAVAFFSLMPTDGRAGGVAWWGVVVGAIAFAVQLAAYIVVSCKRDLWSEVGPLAAWLVIPEIVAVAVIPPLFYAPVLLLGGVIALPVALIVASGAIVSRWTEVRKELLPTYSFAAVAVILSGALLLCLVLWTIYVCVVSFLAEIGPA